MKKETHIFLDWAFSIVQTIGFFILLTVAVYNYKITIGEYLIGIMLNLILLNTERIKDRP